MSRRFRVSRQADADLDEIALNIGADNPSAAIDVLDKLHETFLLLAEHPEIGTLREDLVPRIRMFCPTKPASSYIIFYYPLPDGIEISDVIHGARDWLGLFRTSQRGQMD